MGTDIFLVLSPKVSGAMAKTIIEHSIHNLVHTSLKLIVGIREMGCKFEAAQFGVDLHMAVVVVRVQLFSTLDDSEGGSDGIFCFLEE